MARESTLKWEDAPDTITPEELAKILGISIVASRTLFDKPDFPKISKRDIGNVGKADKEAVRLYIQGINVKKDNKNALLYLIYTELKKLNDKKVININSVEEKNTEEIKAEATVEMIKNMLLKEA